MLGDRLAPNSILSLELAATIEDAVNLMREHEISQVPVIEGESVVLQGDVDRRAGRPTGEDSFLTSQLAGHQERILVRDGMELIDD